MPHNPLENSTPLSNGRGQQIPQHQRHPITSRSPPIHSNYAIHKSRNNSALDIGSILNPVSATTTTATVTSPPGNSTQNGIHINNKDNLNKINDHCYQHSPPLQQSSHGPPPLPPAKQMSIVYNGTTGSQSARMAHEYTSRAMPPSFSNATTTTKKPTPIPTSTMNMKSNNGGCTSDGSDADDNHTQKKLPHRKRSKEKSTTIDSIGANNIDANVPGTITPTSEATLKWQPVETPQGHNQHYPSEPFHNNIYNANNSRLPLTNGYQQQQQQQQPSAEIHSISPTTPMHAAALPPPSTEFVNTMHHGHSYQPHQKHEPSAGPPLIQPPQQQPMYDTLSRQNSASIYTGGTPTTTTTPTGVSSPNHSGNIYYYYQYPTPESPNINSSSVATSPFFNNEITGVSDSRKRSLPLDSNQQPKRTRENSDIVTTPPYPMQPSTSASSSSSHVVDQQQPVPESYNSYYPFPTAPHPHQQQHPMYYHHQPPPHHQHHSHAQSPYPPSSMDFNSMQHYQHYSHSLPPLPPPTPPIKEKKKKKPKSTEPGKPAKKGRPLKNPPTSTTSTTQHDAGSSLKLKELSSSLPDISTTSPILPSQPHATSPATPTKPLVANSTTLEEAKKPKKRGRPPKTEAQKAADAAARAAAAKAAALANPPSPSSDNNNTTKKKSTKKAGKQSSAAFIKKEKEAIRYCICQSTLTTPKYMILCDHCQQWFHGACMDVTAKEGEFFDLYYCKACTAITEKKSTRRLPCANTAQCQNPARASTRGNSRSKYCSEECGMHVARMRLEQAQQSYETDHATTITEQQDHAPPSLSLEKKLKGMLQAVQQQKQGKSQLNIDSNQWDLSRLARMKEERAKARAIVKFVDTQAQFLNQVVESQVENDPKMCGYDSRLAWQSSVWHAIKHISREGTDVKVELSNNIEGVDVHEFTVCNKMGKCQKHEHWRELRQSELEVERRKQIDILTSLDRKRKLIKSRISDRLKQPEGWTFLDNGTICHD